MNRIAAFYNSSQLTDLGILLELGLKLDDKFNADCHKRLRNVSNTR